MYIPTAYRIYRNLSRGYYKNALKIVVIYLNGYQNEEIWYTYTVTVIHYESGLKTEKKSSIFLEHIFFTSLNFEAYST